MIVGHIKRATDNRNYIEIIDFFITAGVIMCRVNWYN